MTIRPMRTGDVEDIARLSGELGYPTTAADVTERFDALVGREDHAVFVAEDRRVVIGWVHVHDDWTLEAGRTAELLGLVVAAARRGDGVGRSLVAEAERWAAKRRAHYLRVRSNVVREASHQFYPALGYARVKTQHVYAKRLESGLNPEP